MCESTCMSVHTCVQCALNWGLCHPSECRVGRGDFPALTHSASPGVGGTWLTSAAAGQGPADAHGRWGCRVGQLTCPSQGETGAEGRRAGKALARRGSGAAGRARVQGRVLGPAEGSVAPGRVSVPQAHGAPFVPPALHCGAAEGGPGPEEMPLDSEGLPRQVPGHSLRLSEGPAGSPAAPRWQPLQGAG